MTTFRATQFGRVLAPIFSSETWSATGFLLATLLVGVWWLVITVVLVAVGFATLVLAIGVPILAAVAAVLRTAARSERGRLRAVGIDVAGQDPERRGNATGWERLIGESKDPTNYRRLTFFLLMVPVGSAWLSLTIVAWVVPLALLSTPAMLALGYEPTASSEAGEWEIRTDSMTQAGIIATVGMILLPLAPRIVRRMVGLHGRLANALLGVDGTSRNAAPLIDHGTYPELDHQRA
ncbi:MAG: hypothetical protein GY939_17370 [Actinomycetia bacterium]|nr:hypothetical protein [Actinomycetes bacterium]